MNILNWVKRVGWRGLGLVGLLLLGAAVPGLSAAANVDVQIATFTDSPDPATRGGQITYTTVVKNGGPAIATDVVVTWPVPATTTFVSVSDGSGGGTCIHNGATPGVVTCSYASFPVDLTSADWKTITLVVQTGATTPATVASSVSVSQTGNTDTNGANDTLTQNTTINAGADLSFAIGGAPNPSVGAGNVTWSITGANLGPDTSGPIAVTVPIPGTLTYQSGSGTGWSCSYSAPTAVCTRAPLASGASYATLSIVTKIASQISGGTLTVGGSISETTVADPVSANNTATASVTVNPGLDLEIIQDPPSPSSANAGGVAMTFVLKPRNLGPYDATTGANVSFPLPANFTLTSATGTNGWTCSSAGTPITVTCSLASSMVSGANSVLTILTGTPATVTGTTSYTLTGTVAVNSGGPTDPIAGNNTAARTVTVTPIGLDLSVAKTKTPALVAEGVALTTIINIASAAGGVQAVTGTITVTDLLDPTFETFAGSSGTNWACSATALPAASQTVTCVYNAILNGGSSASALTITTTAVAAGTATNNASVAYSGTPGDYNPVNNGPVSRSTVITAVSNNAPDLIAGLTVSTLGGTATTLETNESTVSFIATLTNDLTAADDAVNTKMTLTIPARVTGTSMAAITVAVTNTSGLSTATYTCTPVAGTLATSTIVCTQNAGILKPGDLVTFTVPVSRPLLDGTFTNPPNVVVTSTTQGDPIPANNTAAASVIIEPVADIELVSKLITSANPAKAGTEVTYVVTIRNNGPSSADGVSIADVFTIPSGDTGFTFVSAVASNSGTCTGLTTGTTYTPGTPTLTCSWAVAVASAATRTVTIVIRPNWMTGDPTRTLLNTATVTTSTVENPAGGDNGNNSKTATLTIDAAQVDALINNTDVPDPLGYDPAAGAIGTASTNNDVTYNVAVTNNGPSLVSGLGFTYTMTAPAGKTITFRGDGAAATVASTTTSGTIAGSICNNVGNSVTGATLTLTCAFAAPGQLANLATVNRYLVFRVGTPPATAGDTYNTNATVITNETDSNATNNSELESTTVRQRVDLTIAKTPSITPVQLRQPFNWTITLTNTGPGNSDTTTLTDTLPAEMAFFGAAPSFTTTGVVKTGTCGVSGQVMTCNISTGSANPLNVGEVATVTVPVRMTTYPTTPTAGTATNCASAVTDQVDPAAGNNTSVCTDLTVQRSSIAGRVFNDPNRDGLFAYTTGAAGTDTGMNVSNIVVLTGMDAYGNVVNLTKTTSGSAGSAGAYLFNDLSPADATGYTVTETQPTTHINGPTDPPAPTLSGSPTAGDQGVYARGGLAGNSIYSAIKLAANQAGTNYNFPEVQRPSLGGTVYVDANANNLFDSATDPKIQGAIVILRNAVDLANSVATTTTLANGTYSFTLLDPLITYVLEEPLPTTPAGLGNRATAVNVGTVSAVATGTAAANTPEANTDRITGVDLSLGVDGINYNFGEDLATTISGVVYNDRSRDGSKNGTEPGIEGVSLKLVAGTDCTAVAFAYTGLVNPVTTAATTGFYSFSPVPAGAQYTICETQPAGYADGPVGPATSIMIASLLASGATGNNFPEVLGSISGKVFADFGSGTIAFNNNGTQQTSEPGIGSGTANLGVPVTLTGTTSAGPALPVGGITVYTDALGDYGFGDLYPGSYVVAEGVIPALLGTFNDGINTAGPVSVGGTVGTAGPVGVSTISNIILAAGSQGTGNNFAELPVTSISGVVYLDINENNVMDATPIDDRIGGATLTLYAGSTCTGAVVDTATSSAGTGAYSFLNLSAGLNYTVCETQPAGFEEGAVNTGTNAALTTATINAITVTNLPSTGSANNNFGERVGIDLRVYKTHTPTTFSTDNIGTYTLRVRNVGLQASSGAYTVTDNLPPGMTLASAPTGTGWVCTGLVGATSMACTSSISIAAGITSADVITVRVNVPATVAAVAQPVYNVVYVEGGGEPDQKKPTLGEKSGPATSLPDCDSNITQNICRDPTTVILSASLSGTVWYDVGPQTRVLDAGDRRLQGWTVEVLDATNSVIGRAVTGANGTYLVDKLPAKVALSVRFREPSSNVTWGYPVNGEQVSGSPAPCDATAAITAGISSSCVVRAPDSQLSVVLAPGINLVEQSLPVDPSGVVYDAVTRLPVPGSVVTLAPTGLCTGWDPATAIVGAGAGGYTIDGANISMTVGADGFYQYLFVPGSGAPASCTFTLTVTPPATHRFVSGIIPPETGTLSPPGGAATVYLVQPQALAPTAGVGLDTRYFLSVTAGNTVAGIVHNHIPLDPGILSKLVLTKTGDRRIAEIGDTVLYTLSVRNVAGEALPQVTLRDRLPAGFTLIKGTVKTQLDTGAWISATDPAGHLGPVLGFNLGTLGVNTTVTLQYRVRVGVGAMQGTGINIAKAHGCGAAAGCMDSVTLQPLVGTVDSNEARHKVEVTGGVFTDDACLLGKVFVDCNNNHIQDAEELGIPGVRLYLENGQFMVTDSEGKYSRCGITPRSHVLTPDPSTLPRGSVLTTTSNRNLGDANSLFIDLKNGELHRGDFAEGSCTNPVLEQVKARRSQGEVRSVETEKSQAPALRFQSKPLSTPQQGTDSANQPLVQPRQGASDAR